MVFSGYMPRSGIPSTTVHKIDKQQDLLYSTGYYIQCVVITYNGKESKYIYIFESLCYTPGTDTTP